MGRLNAFRLYWADAWGFINHGCDAILEVSDNENTLIRFRINGESYSIDLTGIENEFIEDVLKISSSWNRHEYCNPWYQDGTQWRFVMQYDDKQIKCSGTNGYPKDFKSLLRLLHLKYHLPKIDEGKSMQKDMFVDGKIIYEADDTVDSLIYSYPINMKEL